MLLTCDTVGEHTPPRGFDVRASASVGGIYFAGSVLGDLCNWSVVPKQLHLERPCRSRKASDRATKTDCNQIAIPVPEAIT